jgi:hypothetical protein
MHFSSRWCLAAINAVTILAALTSCADTSAAQAPQAQKLTGLGPGDFIWGVTVDDVSNLKAIPTSLGKLSKKPTTRVVFDEYVAASDYLNAVTAIQNVSFVMGEILDSSSVALYSPQAYRDRTTEYLNTLGGRVDIWEVGNEINGEWLCAKDASHCTAAQTADVVAKMSGAYDLVKQAGGKTALTLYYNKGCYADAKNEMFTWANANVPASMKSGLDYVLISYYEDDCNGLQPDWQAVFTKLAAMFPNSSLGMGECGTAKKARKTTYINRYYRMKVNVPRYVGGYFWWYFKQDMVPYTNSLWSVLDNAIAGT